MEPLELKDVSERGGLTPLPPLSSKPALSVFQSSWLKVRHVTFSAELTKVYATVLSRHHHLVRKSDSIYDPMEYENHPELYTSHFRTSVS